MFKFQNGQYQMKLTKLKTAKMILVQIIKHIYYISYCYYYPHIIAETFYKIKIC